MKLGRRIPLPGWRAHRIVRCRVRRRPTDSMNSVCFNKFWCALLPPLPLAAAPPLAAALPFAETRHSALKNEGRSWHIFQSRHSVLPLLQPTTARGSAAAHNSDLTRRALLAVFPKLSQRCCSQRRCWQPGAMMAARGDAGILFARGGDGSSQGAFAGMMTCRR